MGPVVLRLTHVVSPSMVPLYVLADKHQNMATVLRISTSVFSKPPKVSSHPVRHRQTWTPARKRKFEYEFLTNKDPYPDAPRVARGPLKYYPR